MNDIPITGEISSPSRHHSLKRSVKYAWRGLSRSQRPELTEDGNRYRYRKTTELSPISEEIDEHKNYYDLAECLSIEVADLQKQLRELKGQNDAVACRNIALTAQRKRIREERNNARLELEDLKTKYSGLDRDYQELLVEGAGCLKENDALSDLNIKLRREIIHVLGESLKRRFKQDEERCRHAEEQTFSRIIERELRTALDNMTTKATNLQSALITGQNVELEALRIKNLQLTERIYSLNLMVSSQSIQLDANEDLASMVEEQLRDQLEREQSKNTPLHQQVAQLSYEKREAGYLALALEIDVKALTVSDICHKKTIRSLEAKVDAKGIGMKASEELLDMMEEIHNIALKRKDDTIKELREVAQAQPIDSKATLAEVEGEPSTSSGERAEGGQQKKAMTLPRSRSGNAALMDELLVKAKAVLARATAIPKRIAEMRQDRRLALEAKGRIGNYSDADKYVELERSLRESVKANEKLESRITLLNDELEEKDMVIARKKDSSLMRRLADSQSSVRTLTSKIESLSGDYKDLEEENSALGGKIKSYMRIFSEIDQEVADFWAKDLPFYSKALTIEQYQGFQTRIRFFLNEVNSPCESLMSHLENLDTGEPDGELLQELQDAKSQLETASTRAAIAEIACERFRTQLEQITHSQAESPGSSSPIPTSPFLPTESAPNPHIHIDDNGYDNDEEVERGQLTDRMAHSNPAPRMLENVKEPLPQDVFGSLSFNISSF